MSRAELSLFFAALQAKALVMFPHEIDRLSQKLAAIDWQTHVTDDIYRCLLCGVQDNHAPDCPALRLLAETAATS